jgi:hypothetical protein
VGHPKKVVAILFVAVVGGLAGLYLHSHAQGDQSKQKLQPARSDRPTLRQQDVYEAMFRHYGFLRQKAYEIQSVGNDGPGLRHLYKHQAKLTDQEASFLDEVATDCLSKLSDLDTRAKAVIDIARARVPKGQLREGEVPPHAPPELDSLQRQREAAVLEARERLRSVFSPTSFTRFDDFVQKSIAMNIRDVIPLDRHQPALIKKSRR